MNPTAYRRAAWQSVLSSLRALLPPRSLQFDDGLRIAERQAELLLRLRHIDGLPVPMAVIGDLPKITIVYDRNLPTHATSGVSDWDEHRRTWVISLNPCEPRSRQRFSGLHEYKHIVDYGHPGFAAGTPRSIYGLRPTEYIADYFAGCVLVPKRLLQRAFFDGIQHPSDLAQLFDVSSKAIRVRLLQVGLAEPAQAVHHAERPSCNRRGHLAGWPGPYEPKEVAL